MARDLKAPVVEKSSLRVMLRLAAGLDVSFLEIAQESDRVEADKLGGP